MFPQRQHAHLESPFCAHCHYREGNSTTWSDVTPCYSYLRGMSVFEHATHVILYIKHILLPWLLQNMEMLYAHFRHDLNVYLIEERMNKNWIGLESIHLMSKLTFLSGLSLQKERHLSSQFLPMTRCLDETGRLRSMCVQCCSEIKRDTKNHKSTSDGMCIKDVSNDSVNTFPWKRTRATIWRPLLGKGSVNTPSQQYRGCVFCVVCAEEL